MNTEEVIFNIIVHAGNAKGFCFQALSEAKKANMDCAKELMTQANEELLKAHHVQTKMLQAEAGGEKVELNLLMVHAQDHLMNASLAKDLIAEMMDMLQAK